MHASTQNSPTPSARIGSRFILSALLLFAGASTMANAQTTVYLTAEKDNTIYSDNTNNSNGLGVVFVVGKTSSTLRRGLIAFNLSGIAPGSTITSVTLTMVCTQAAANNPQSESVELHKASIEWGEGSSVANNAGQGTAASANDATWSCSFADGQGNCDTAWSSGGGDFTSTVSASTTVSSTGTYTWSSTAMKGDVQEWVNSASTNHGWALIGDEASSSSRTAKWFASKDASSNLPVLTVTYTIPLPVELTSFSARRDGGSVQLTWNTASELNLLRYTVERQAGATGVWSAIGSVNGRGSTDTPMRYSFIDPVCPTAGRVSYRLRMTDRDGTEKFSPVVSVLSTVSTDLFLVTVSPAPARGGRTVVSFTTERDAPVTLRVSDALGRVARTIIDAVNLQPGSYSYPVDLSSLRPGTYYLLAQTPDRQTVRPLVVLP